MDKHQQHLYADYICVFFMIMGFFLAVFKFTNWIGLTMLLTGMIGMTINEKLNPWCSIDKSNEKQGEEE